MSNLWKLVKYTQGENADSRSLSTCPSFVKESSFRLEKTFKIFLPIMVKVRPSMSDEKENQFTLMLMLDKQFSLDSPPPLPTAEGVFTNHNPQQVYYARRFGGFAKEADWKRESTNLLQVCKGLQINSAEVLSATYDMPTKLMSRRNEVLVAEIPPAITPNEPSDSASSLEVEQTASN